MEQIQPVLEQLAQRISQPCNMSLEKFSGDGQASTVWWQMFEQWLTLQHYNNVKALSYLPFLFSGQAATWYQTLPADTKQILNQMKTVFLTRFNSNNN